MTQQYTFYVDGTHRFENVNGETREEALQDAAFLLNTDKNNLVELPQLPPLLSERKQRNDSYNSIDESNR